MSVTELRPPFTIGVSEVAACAGLDPYCSPVMLWAQKTGRVQAPDETEAMRWGTRLEPLIFDALRERYAAVVRDPGWAETDPERRWLVGHPDGIAEDPAGTLLVEAKTVGHWANAHGNGVPPLHYQAQGQLYLHLTGLERVLFAILVAGQRLELHEQPRDQRAIDLLLEAARAMYDHCLSDTPPPVARKGDALLLHPQAEAGTRIREDKTARDIRLELQARMEQQRVIGEQIDRLKERYQAFMGDAAVAINAHDTEVAKWPPRVDHRLSVTRLRQERPELAALFTDETTTRRFTLL